MDVEKKIKLSIDYAKIVEEDESLCIAEIDLLHLGLNRNNSIFTKESVMNSIDSFYNKPIVTIFDCDVKSISSDFKAHASNQNEENQRCCVGVIPLPEVSNPRWIYEDDAERLRMNIYLWKYYSEDTIRILSEKDGESKVSIEIVPMETHKDKYSNVVIDKFNFLGVSFLGDKIAEGMKGSKLKVIKYSLDETIKKTKEYSVIKNKNIENFKNKGENKVNIGNMELEKKLWAILSSNTYIENDNVYPKYYLTEIYKSHIVCWDNQEWKEMKFKYYIDKDGNTSIDFENGKMIDREKDVRKFAKEDIATKEAVSINEEELSDDEWGSIDKSNIKKRVFEAKNFKTIAPKVFLKLIEGWEEGENTKMKYPVMQFIKDNTLCYNRNALSSAKAYATKNNETEVLNKLEKIYAKMGLDFESNEDEIMYKCGGMDYEDAYDVDNKKEMAEDDNMKEMAEDEMGNMPIDENVEASAQTEMLGKESKQQKEDSDKQLEDGGNEVVIAEKDKEMLDMYEKKIKKYEEDISEYKAKLSEYEVEIKELKEFKSKTEEIKKEYKIESVFSECKEDLSDNKISELKEMSKDYSLENIDIWANAVRSEAFKNSKQSKSESFQRMDVWQLHKEQKQYFMGL